MTRRNQFRAFMGLVFVIAVVVGVLVWPEPKEARADQQYSVAVRIWDVDAEEYDLGFSRDITMNFPPDGPYQENSGTTATASHTLPAQAAGNWTATFDDWQVGYSVYYDADRLNPGANGTLTFSNLDVSVTMYVLPENNR